jgi:hypothetical protein
LINSEATDPVFLIAQAWHEAGTRAPTPIAAGNPNAGACMVPGCGGSGWVKLKTYHGMIALCFGHFQSVRGLSQ